MTIAQNQAGIARSYDMVIPDVGGTPARALVTSSLPDVRAWRDAINAMLRWLSNPAEFEPDDAPDPETLLSAIDYAVDQSADADGSPAPCSIVPSGNGRVSMEWNDGPVTISVEFVGAGLAEYSEFHDRKLRQRATLRRNPLTRKLELRG